jgi:hypothetical protein
MSASNDPRRVYLLDTIQNVLGKASASSSANPFPLTDDSPLDRFMNEEAFLLHASLAKDEKVCFLNFMFCANSFCQPFE